MWRRLKWTILWSLWAARLVLQPTTPVLVSNGWMRGSIAPSGRYKQYMGIPYATIVNRFQAPGPEPIWDGVFDAVNENIRCKQSVDPFSENATTHSSYSVIGQDDCLTLNVYTPLPTSSKPLPVMVYIHGGGFLVGSGSKMVFGPEYLISKGVILVTMNYRLNVEGFLCLGIKEAPGNAGLKDQVAALKWVRRNIREFGGDPEDVTLFGESAGGASVSLHILSSMSKGLFHKAIIQSGSSLSPWAIQFEPIQTAIAKARALGYTGTSKDPHDLYNFFKSKTSLEIINHLTKRIEGNILLSRLIFAPCIEQNLDGLESFMTELPYKLLVEGRYNKVPMITGSNSEEGIVLLNVEEQITESAAKAVIPNNLAFPNATVKNIIFDKAKNLYFGDDLISFENIRKFSKYHGELSFNYPVLEETDLILKTNDQPMFNYYFNYSGWRNLPKFAMNSALRKVSGAAHADDLFYIFSQELVPSQLENRMIDAVTTMWTNFAKYGDPTPAVSELLPVRWPELRAGDQRSLCIDRDLSAIPLWYNNTTLLYWRSVYAKYRRKS